MLNRLTRAVPAAVAALALTILVSGCEDAWRDACKAEGGTVTSEREKCGTKTSGTGTSRRTTDKYETERECVDSEGREITADDTGACL